MLSAAWAGSVEWGLAVYPSDSSMKRVCLASVVKILNSNNFKEAALIEWPAFRHSQGSSSPFT